MMTFETAGKVEEIQLHFQYDLCALDAVREAIQYGHNNPKDYVYALAGIWLRLDELNQELATCVQALYAKEKEEKAAAPEQRPSPA